MADRHPNSDIRRKAEGRRPVSGWGARYAAVAAGVCGFGIPAWLALYSAVAVVMQAQASAADAAPFRIAFFSSMFTEVNENDARAAMKVWIQTVAKERGIPVDPDPTLYSTVEAAVAASRTNQLDGFGLTMVEFGTISKQIKFDRIAVSSLGGSTTDSYVLLVRDDSGWTGVEQLEKRSLTVLHNPRMSLAMIWLDTLLLQKGLKRAAGFCGRATLEKKATKVALPVFFRQADACLMTRRSFETMAELNPQVGKQLRILAASPEVVPTGLVFRADYRSPFRELIFAEMIRLSGSPAGQQILTLTQADHIEERPLSCLDSALELLATHERLCGGTVRKGQ